MVGSTRMATRCGPGLQVRAATQLVDSLLRSRLSPTRRAARRHHTEYYRGLWTAAAEHVGAQVRMLRGGDLEITLGSCRIWVRGTHCSIDGPEVLDRAGDKVLGHRLLAESGLTTPEHCTFTLAELDRARRFLTDAPGDCVVKPGQDGAAGQGVTTRVREARDLRQAAVVAAAAGARSSRAVRSGSSALRLMDMFRQLGDVPLLIEHQVTGENYRLLYLDGVLVDALLRGSPTVVGDGRTSVGGLLDRLNAERLRAGGKRAQMLVSRDLDTMRTLADQGLTLASVPVEGIMVQLKTTINENAPDNNRSARDELCASIVEDGARAAAAVGARWAGVDVITADPAVPLARSGGCILEVNTTPGLAMHYHNRRGQTEPAKLLLAHLFGTAECGGGR